MKYFSFLITSFLAIFPVSILHAAQADLVVTDVWNDNGIIRYQLLNAGEIKVSDSFKCGLFVDGNYRAVDFVNTPIEAGDRINRYFDKYTFQCSDCSDQVKIIADSDDDIYELAENNNDRTEEWSCSETTPEITTSAYLGSITNNSVTIKWVTDQDTDSTVKFSPFANTFSNEISSGTLVKNHEIEIKNLTSSTTYNYIVESANNCGDTVTGKTCYFTTLPQSNIKSPSIISHVKSSQRWPMEFTTDIDDASVVEKVAYYLDDKLTETDYSWPYQFTFDPLWLNMSKDKFLQSHEIRAEAVGLNGNIVTDALVHSPWSFCGPVEYDFRSPYDGYEVLVYGDTVPEDYELSVYVEASESEWIETVNRYGFTMIQGTPVERIEFWFDGEKIFEESETTSLSEYLDISGLPIGSYEAVAKVYTHDCGMVRQESHVININPRRDDLAIGSRYLRQDGNYFTVRTILENHAPEPSRIIDITDTLRGFQVVDTSTHDYTVRGEYDPASKTSTVEIEFMPDLWIGGWATYEIEYAVVPILYKDFDDYCVGVDDIRWNYEHYTDGLTEDNKTIRWQGPLFSDNVDAAVKTADYLIVTSPENLFVANSNPEDVRQLLSKMAELAVLRNGTLAYFNSNSSNPAHYDSSDKLTSGYMVDDTIDAGNQIVLLDDEEDKIRIYNETLQLFEFDWPGLSSGDAVDAGNVSFRYGTLLHPFDEIVVAMDEGTYAGRTVVFRVNLDGTGIFKLDGAGFACGYSHGDGLAVGNVLTDTDEAEIILADKDSGNITVYDESGAVESTISGTPYRSGDVLLSADLLGDSAEEIIVADKSADLVYVYDAVGLLGSVSFSMAADDEIFTADVWGGAKSELIIADDSDDKIRYASMQTIGSVLNLTYRGVVDHYIHRDDAFCADNISNLVKSQIVIARGKTTQRHNRGEIEVLRIDGGKALDRYSFNELINEHGQWAEKLADGWAEDGYLLIVGEIEIIPTYARDYEMWYLENAGKSTRRVDYTDSYYASTDDDPHRPDLNMGRIIGDTAANLIVPIQTSIDLARGIETLDNSNALVCSGHPRGASGTSDNINFASERNAIDNRLDAMGFDSEELNEPTDVELLTAALNKDAIHIAAHGNWDYCDPISSGDVDNYFNRGNTHPIVYADSCITGRYPNGYSLAEAFLNNGASVYIGATRSALSPYCKWLATRFWDRIDNGIDLGSAFKDAKRNVISAGDHWWEDGRILFINGMFHYYGDPKIEVTGLPLASAASTVKANDVSSLAITYSVSGKDISTSGTLTESISIPAYTVTAYDGIDTVEIPNGQMLAVIGNPEVPVYSVEYTIAQGIRVSNVELVEKSSKTITDSNLNLMIVEPLEPGDASSSYPPADAGREWFPAKDFDWYVTEESGGSRTLLLTIYPFNYNRNRLESEFCPDYTFEITTVESSVEIVHFETDKIYYEPGETVNVDLHLNNTSGKDLDVIVENVIETADQAIVNLQLTTLPQVNGLATSSYSWDSTQSDPNDYTWQINIKDTTGQILATGHREFSIGMANGQITGLDVMPTCFSVNDIVNINLDFENTGSRILDCKVILEVRDTSDLKLFEDSSEIENMLPGQSVQCPFIWEAAADRGECRVIAYAEFDGHATETTVWPAIEIGLYGDLNNDDSVDLADFAVLANSWLLQDQQDICDIAPVGGDCAVDVLDFDVMVSEWLSYLK